MNNKSFIGKWAMKVIDLHRAKSVLDEATYEETMIQLLTELLGETSVSDAEYESRKDSLRFFGVKDSDVFEILAIASKELEGGE